MNATRRRTRFRSNRRSRRHEKAQAPEGRKARRAVDPLHFEILFRPHAGDGRVAPLSQVQGAVRTRGFRCDGAAIAFFVLSFVSGGLLGGPELGTRKALAVMAGMRNGGVALMIASQTFDDPGALMMVITASVIMFMTIPPTAYWWGRRSVRETSS